MMRALLLVFGLTGCTQFPTLDAVHDPNAVTPALLPTDELVARLPRINTNDPLAARTATLRARAAALRNR